MFVLLRTLLLVPILVLESESIANDRTPRFSKLVSFPEFFGRRPKYPHLLAFHDDSEFSRYMIPVVARVVKETGLHIEIMQLSDENNLTLFMNVLRLAKQGGLPFYFNLKTEEFICGITTFENLKAWALGGKPEQFPEMNVQMFEDASFRITGFWGRIKRLIREIKQRGEENIFKKYSEGNGAADAAE